MTSQIEKTMDELKKEAKELGVKGYGLIKDRKLLLDKIEKAKAGKLADSGGRKKAPSMKVENILQDDRAALVKQLEKEDPECKYIFQSGAITDRELAAKGLERTGHQVRNDILCRTTKESYDEVQKAKRDFQFESMQNIDGGKGIIDSKDETPKKPRTG